MKGGIMHLEGSPFSSVEEGDLVPHEGMKLLLLAHPDGNDCFVWDGLNPTDRKDALEVLLANVRCVKWEAVEKSVSSVKCLRVVPALALNSAPVPSITRDEAGKLVVNTGPEPCSVGTVMLYSPMDKTTNSVNPDMLAKKLGSSVSNFEVDDREVQEAIVVLLDTSSSMGGYSFGDEDLENDDDVTITLTPKEVEEQLEQLRSHPHINLYREIAQSGGFKTIEVLKELSDDLSLRYVIGKEHIILFFSNFLFCFCEIKQRNIRRKCWQFCRKRSLLLRRKCQKRRAFLSKDCLTLSCKSSSRL
jgi:hypothetical protein